MKKAIYFCSFVFGGGLWSVGTIPHIMVVVWPGRLPSLFYFLCGQTSVQYPCYQIRRPMHDDRESQPTTCFI